MALRKQKCTNLLHILCRKTCQHLLCNTRALVLLAGHKHLCFAILNFNSLDRHLVVHPLNLHLVFIVMFQLARFQCNQFWIDSKVC